ncbi:hypothetical protein FCH79_08990 [Pseudomonas koreensis]|nr:hypothetical protein [Pseudomonas koreensis]
MTITSSFNGLWPKVFRFDRVQMSLGTAANGPECVNNVRLGFQDIENALEKIVETGIFESGDIVDQYALEAALT